jgi:hypothetical protein
VEKLVTGEIQHRSRLTMYSRSMKGLQIIQNTLNEHKLDSLVHSDDLDALRLEGITEYDAADTTWDRGSDQSNASNGRAAAHRNWATTNLISIARRPGEKEKGYPLIPTLT